MKYINRKGKIFGKCLSCPREVEGVEEKGIGPKPIIRFNCKCGAKWFKEKLGVEIAIAGGYRNGLGEWIKCDKNGRITPEEIAKINNEGKKVRAEATARLLVDIAKNIIEKKEKPPTDKLVLAAFNVLKNGGTKDNAIKTVIAVYLTNPPKV